MQEKGSPSISPGPSSLHRAHHPNQQGEYTLSPEEYILSPTELADIEKIINPSEGGGTVAILCIALVVAILIMWMCCLIMWMCCGLESDSPDSEPMRLTVDEFLNDIEREKPMRFTNEQLRIATDNYSHFLGSGGFGEVYKGKLRDGRTLVAVKVLKGSSGKKIEQQFMAEIGTIGRIHHFNLVRLYGFCFERNFIALVYEYMENGSLEKYLFRQNKVLGFEKLHEIAIGTARGIAYLHEDCLKRIIHYDIKPGNILLDRDFNPKVADFGLARLCNRENTHITMTCGRGTPGYAAPEIWMPFPVTHKCDVYSFGMLLFEIIGRRRNLDIELPESQQEWFPILVWKKVDVGQVGELVITCGIEEKNKENAERMVKVALWCVQYRPESRPIMSVVVKMLEGSLEIPKPLNPFQHLMDGNFIDAKPVHSSETNTDTNVCTSGSSAMVTEYSVVRATPIMTKYEIELASA